VPAPVPRPYCPRGHDGVKAGLPAHGARIVVEQAGRGGDASNLPRTRPRSLLLPAPAPWGRGIVRYVRRGWPCFESGPTSTELDSRRPATNAGASPAGPHGLQDCGRGCDCAGKGDGVAGEGRVGMAIRSRLLQPPTSRNRSRWVDWRPSCGCRAALAVWLTVR
jgi:hypothetical protein